jgi:hypothetical protein
MYRQYFPHLALAHARRALGLSGETDTAGRLVAATNA